jgi:hypothetical protein
MAALTANIRAEVARRRATNTADTGARHAVA